jgi:DNA-binding response OmpR family regulator
MSGRLMAERLAVRHPGVRVLFMSGNTELVRMVRLVEDTEDAILAKPFTSEQLIQRVGEMLAYRAKANAA